MLQEVPGEKEVEQVLFSEVPEETMGEGTPQGQTRGEAMTNEQQFNERLAFLKGHAAGWVDGMKEAADKMRMKNIFKNPLTP